MANPKAITVMQKKFIDEYIANGGNGAAAARYAGYADPRTAAHRLLNRKKTQKELKRRTEAYWTERAMTVQEALAITASIARGDVQESYFEEYDEIKKKATRKVRRKYRPSIEDRQRSLEHIFKVNGAFLDKKEVDVNQVVEFIDDVAGQAD